MDLTFKQGTDCNEEFYSKEWLVAYIRQYWEKKKKNEMPRHHILRIKTRKKAKVKKKKIISKKK